MTASDILAALGGLMRSFGAPVGELVPLQAPSKRGDQYVAVRNDYRLDRLPAPRKVQRTHTFHDLRSFAEWLERFATEPKQTEILVGETQAAAVLGTDPDAWRPECQLRAHPTFEALTSAFGKQMGPREFHAFVRSVQDAFAPPGHDGPHNGDKLLAELAKLKVVTGADVDFNIDPRGYFTLNGAKNSVQIDAKIDPTFDVWSPVLIGIPGDTPEEPEKRYKLGLVLTLEPREAQLLFTLTCPGLKVVKHEARMDAVSYLRELLAGGEFLVGLGDEETEIVEG